MPTALRICLKSLYLYFVFGMHSTFLHKYYLFFLLSIYYDCTVEAVAPPVYTALSVVGTNPTWGVLCVRLIYVTGNIPKAVVVKKKFEGSIFQAKIFVSFYDVFLKCAG